jgi:hypothetical protein
MIPKANRKIIIFPRPRTNHPLTGQSEDERRQSWRSEAVIRLEDKAVTEESNGTKIKSSHCKSRTEMLQRAKGSMRLRDFMTIAIVAFQILLTLPVAYAAYHGLTEIPTPEPIPQELPHDKSFTGMLLAMLATLFGIYN